MNTAHTSFASATIVDQVSVARVAQAEINCSRPSRRAAAVRLCHFCGLVLSLSLTGCGYTVGNNFSRDIQTVAVPIFDNKTNRRGLEFQLTEAVQKEITKRSPYRLAKGTQADTRLTGTIVSFRKDVLGETRFDDGRELQISLMVKVQWEDLRSGQVLAQQEIPLSPEAIPMTSQAEFSPEVGQSLATALDDANQSLARKIVNLMELPSL
ncbi:LPS assembly lipoprotein LptE [Schlesneria paludicola]|uniref:LPS assembly lipoprotein LptE n=1 Tax=Schlesneria paludicola TaxID=360056 RepID=UPI00029A803C|nr:LPS assembly lipoprotein LptE [Schlesneria paludicola]